MWLIIPWPISWKSDDTFQHEHLQPELCIHILYLNSTSSSRIGPLPEAKLYILVYSLQKYSNDPIDVSKLIFNPLDNLINQTSQAITTFFESLCA